MNNLKLQHYFFLKIFQVTKIVMLACEKISSERTQLSLIPQELFQTLQNLENFIVSQKKKLEKIETFKNFK